MRRRLGLAFLLCLSTCAPPPAPLPASHPKFFVGNGFISGGKWEYPHNFTGYDATGVSVMLQEPRGAITADGEAYDPQALQAASAVLQLPAIVTITNLVNGRRMDVRVNDRLVDNPGRVIGVTPKVAFELGFPTDGVVEVEVVLNAQKTSALDAGLGGGGPKLTAAPEASIQAQNLGAPGQSATGPVQELGIQAADPAGPDPAVLSGVVTAVPPSPGPLWVQVPGFGRARDADETLQSLYGLPAQVVPVFGGDRTLWAIRVGPYHSVQDADAGFATVLQRGVSDPEIIVR